MWLSAACSAKRKHTFSFRLKHLLHVAAHVARLRRLELEQLQEQVAQKLAEAGPTTAEIERRVLRWNFELPPRLISTCD